MESGRRMATLAETGYPSKPKRVVSPRLSHLFSIQNLFARLALPAVTQQREARCLMILRVGISGNLKRGVRELVDAQRFKDWHRTHSATQVGTPAAYFCKCSIKINLDATA